MPASPNDTGVLWTDLEVLLTNPTKNGNAYNCEGTPDFFTTCDVSFPGSNQDPQSVLWHFYGLDATHTGIADVAFTLKMVGFDQGPISST